MHILDWNTYRVRAARPTARYRRPLYLDQIQTALQGEQGRAADAPDLGDAAGDEPAF